MKLGTEISAHGVTRVQIQRKQISDFEVLTITAVDTHGEELTLRLFAEDSISICIESEGPK
jgi:hypothetical protein